METLVEGDVNSLHSHDIAPVVDPFNHPLEDLIQLVQDSFIRHGLGAAPAGEQERATSPGLTGQT